METIALILAVALTLSIGIGLHVVTSKFPTASTKKMLSEENRPKLLESGDVE